MGLAMLAFSRLLAPRGPAPWRGFTSRSGRLDSSHMERVLATMTLPRLIVAALFASFLSPPAVAEDAPVHHHALSLIGEPKYPADFSHFDYVNPDAPKGGSVRMADIGSFDSLNPVLYRGEPDAGLTLAYESLMADSLDEPSTSYG